MNRTRQCLMLTTGDVDRQLGDMQADGTIDDDTADTVRRFAKFLRIVGQAPRDPDGKLVVDPDTYAYAHGEDVEPGGAT